LQQIINQGQEGKQKIKSLQSSVGGACPLCDQNLNDSHKQQVVKQLKQTRAEKVSEYKLIKSKLTGIQGKLAVQQIASDRLRRLLLEKTGWEEKQRHFQSELEQSQKAWRAIEVLEKQKSDLEKQTDDKQTDDKLAAITKKITDLNYNSQQHQLAKNTLDNLHEARELKAQLDKTQDNIKQNKIFLKKLESNLSTRQQKLQTISTARTNINLDVVGLKKIQQELKSQQVELEKYRAKISKGQAQDGAIRERLARLKLLSREITQKKNSLKKSTQDKLQYEELTIAFGKKGIQAMIIDNAIPEIEGAANKLLAKMTDDRMQVRFLTQKQKKTDTGIIETLDIIIEDEMGAKNYEMFSGGEAYRINFAIRIALSKLLANRAGAKLQFLVIDEGFGTQDSLGRESLIEAINSVTSDFAKIIVITHIQELKDAFPVRIEVTKNGNGSRYEVIN